MFFYSRSFELEYKEGGLMSDLMTTEHFAFIKGRKAKTFRIDF